MLSDLRGFQLSNILPKSASLGYITYVPFGPETHLVVFDASIIPFAAFSYIHNGKVPNRVQTINDEEEVQITEKEQECSSLIPVPVHPASFAAYPLASSDWNLDPVFSLLPPSENPKL